MWCCNSNHVKNVANESKSRTEVASAPMEYIHIIVVVSMVDDHTSDALFYCLKNTKKSMYWFLCDNGLRHETVKTDS